MNAFLLYVVQSALCLSLFYGLYLLLLRREAFFRFNRNVLLAIMVSSMVIPSIRIPVAEPTLIQKVSSFEFNVSNWAKPISNLELEPSNLNRASELAGGKLETTTPQATFNMIPLVYLVGFLVSLLLALVSLASVVRIIVTALPVVYRQQRILVSPLKISSFTFAGWIVLSEMDYERFAAEIVTHEAIHRRKGHFWDLCLISVITVVHWFNPLVWLLRREMKALHEYEADRSTLTQGIDATRYQLLLIEKAAGASHYSVASSFAQSKIKKRISMMNKQNLKPWARWKALLFIPLAALMLQAFARPEINRELEQFSTLKSTEFLQENSNWTEEKFFTNQIIASVMSDASRKLLEELRKFMTEDIHSWKEVEKLSQSGVAIAINKKGDMMVKNKYITMEGIPGIIAMNLAEKGEADTPLIINGKKVNKIIRYTLIQRDVNTPADAYQKLLNAVGETYISKRDVMARQYYQTGYNNLDTDKKAVVDGVVPIMVMFATPKDIDSKQERTYSKSIVSEAQIQEYIQNQRSVSEAEWENAANVFDKVNNQQIKYNGQPTKVKELQELLKKDTRDEVKIVYQSVTKKNTREVVDCKVRISAPAIDPKDPEYYYVLGGKWVYSLGILVDFIQAIDVYSPDVAVKKYGNKAKNGAISVTCVPGALDIPKIDR